MDVEATNELKNLGTQALKDLYENLTHAKRFVLDQAPDFCRQIVIYGIAEAVIVAVLCAAYIITWAFVFRFCIKKASEDRISDWDMGALMVGAFGGCGSVIALVLGAASVLDFAKATFAPKLYLVEYLAHLLK